MPSRISELMDDDSDADIEEILLPPVSDAEIEQRRVHDRAIRAELWRIQKLARDTNYTPEEIIENRRGQGSLDPNAAAELLELLEASARWRDPVDPWELEFGPPAGAAEAGPAAGAGPGALFNEGGSIQEEMDDELLQYDSANFGDAIPPEAMEILSGIVGPGKFKGLMSLLNKFFKGGKGAPQTSQLIIKQSTKPAPKDIAQRELDKIRGLLEETPTPHPIRIPRKFNKKRYEDIDPTEKPPLKFKGGGHLYQKGYYGKSYR